MTMSTATASKTTNRYALPTGEIVVLHDHCRALGERFQLKGGAFVTAVRVDGEGDAAEIAAWKEDIKEIMLEARVKGFDPKQMKRIIRTRAMDAEKRKAEEEIYDSYLVALGLA